MLGVRSAHAGPPYPEPISILDPFVVVCPAGDSVFHVQAMGFTGPYPNGVIEVNLCSCPSVHLAPLRPADLYTIVDGCRLQIQSDAQGVADFRIRAGGVFSDPDAGIRVTSNGGYLGGRRLVISPDQDGNLIVDEQDLAIIKSKIGTTDLTADLDEDGAVTANDVEVAGTHLGHGVNTVLAVPTAGADFEVLAPRPNPTRDGATLLFRLARSQSVSIEIFDLSGRVVRTLRPGGELPAGSHALPWNGRDDRGRRVAAGVYMVRVRADLRTLSRSLVVIP
jgi:hypothetical protein